MKKAVYNVMIITIIAKLLGFGRELLLSYFFGANGLSDAYLISQTIPGTIFQFVGTGLATAFIPVYMKVKSAEGNEKANRFSNTILTAILMFSTIAIVIVWVYTEQIVKLFANGFEGDTLYYAVIFTRIGIFSLYFSAMIYIFNSYLQSNGEFSIVAFVAIPNSVVIMLAIVAGAKMDIMALPIGSVFAVFIQVIILLPAMKRQGYRFGMNFEFGNFYVKEMIHLMIPVIIGVSVNQINVLVDRTIASQIAVGGISALIYADSLIMFVQGIFSQSIATVYYPQITKLAEEHKQDELKKMLNEALESMAFMLIPIMLGCIVLGTGIVRALYGRGAFDEEAIRLTGTALSFYGFGIVGYGFREILSRVFYAYHDTKTPMINSMIGMLLNIILNLTLSRTFGIGGLALATSMSSIVTAILLYVHLKKKIGIIFVKAEKIEIFKMLACAVIMGAETWIAYSMVNQYIGAFSAIVISIVSGIIVYFVLAKICRIKMFMQGFKLVKKVTGK